MPVRKTFHAKGKKRREKAAKTQMFQQPFQTAYLSTLIIISVHTISFLAAEWSSNPQSSPVHPTRCCFGQQSPPSKPTHHRGYLRIVYKDLAYSAENISRGESKNRRTTHSCPAVQIESNFRYLIVSFFFSFPNKLLRVNEVITQHQLQNLEQTSF